MLHRSRNSERDFWWNQLPCGPVLTPISCTKLKIHSAHPDSLIVPKQVFFFYLVLAIWKRDQSMLHRSRNSGRDFWWNQLPCGPVLTPISCTKLKIHSAHPDSPIVPKQVFFFFNLVLAIWKRDQSMLHRSRNSGRDFWWNKFPCWPVLTPISCTKLKIHSVMKTVLVLKQVLIFHLFCGTKSMLHRSRKSGRDFWWNQLPCGPVLTPISCTKLKIHSVHTDSPIVPKQLFLSCAGNLDEGPVYASQIKKLRKRFLVEPAPLWFSSYTHLLYKAHDPFSA